MKRCMCLRKEEGSRIEAALFGAVATAVSDVEYCSLALQIGPGNREICCVAYDTHVRRVSARSFVSSCPETPPPARRKTSEGGV